MAVTAGQRVGRYRLVSRVGFGGMAEVWEAQDESLHRIVAVKIILEAVSREPTFTERFVREARTIASLEHPNILPIYDFGREGESVYLVMPLVSGGSLKERLGSPVPLRVGLEWISGLASALDYAHSRGFVHRDVKPANVLIDKKNRPLLSDFGIAKSAGDSIAGLTAIGSVMGTPAYMSPEQAMGQKLDGRSDQYSLGVIAFQLTAGVVPFTADSPLVVLNKHLQEAPPRPSGLNPNLPPAVDQAIEKALRKNPTERYERCEDFSLALARASGASQEAEQVTTKWKSAESERADRGSGGGRKFDRDAAAPTRLRRGKALALAGVTAVIVVGAALVFWSGSRATLAPSLSTGVRRPITKVASPAAGTLPVPSKPPAPLPSPSPQAESSAAHTSRPTRISRTPTASRTPTVFPTTVPTVPPTAVPTPLPVRAVRATPEVVSGTLWTSFFDGGQRALTSGDFRGAEKLFRDAVSEAERFGRSDPRLARSVQRLGATVGNLGRLPEAEALLRRSLVLWEAQPNGPGLDLAENQVNLASVLVREGRAGAGEAEALNRHALNTREKALGPRDPAVAAALEQLAFCYEMQNRHSDAEPLLKRALAIYENPPGAHEAGRAAALNDLGWLYVRKGEAERAEPVLREALDVRKRVLPADHPAIAQSLLNLGIAKEAQKKFSEAEPLLRQCLAIREKSLGSNNSAVAQTLEELAKVLRATHRDAEADQLVSRARSIRAGNN